MSHIIEASWDTPSELYAGVCEQMANKYMTLEEAAKSLGMSTDKLMRLREQGEIRGFADRGSWKFTRESVEELGRLMQADSSPDIPMITDAAMDSDDEDVEFDESFFGDDEDDAAIPVVADAEEFEFEEVAEDSAVEVEFDESFFDDDDDDIEVVAEPTEAAGIVLSTEEDGDTVLEEVEVNVEEGTLDLAASDSDVRLAFDDSVFDPELVEAGSDVQLPGDSSINLTDDSDAEDLAGTSVMDFSEGSDDARDSDSDVQFVEVDSDSDVNIVTDEGSDSDIVLVDSDTDGNQAMLVDDDDFGADLDDESNDSSMIFRGIETDGDIELASTMFPEGGLGAAADSDIRFDVTDEEPTAASVTTPANEDFDFDLGGDMTGSDSDVNLLPEDALASNDSDDSSQVLPGADSVSDIQLADESDDSEDAFGSSSMMPGLDSESDIRLAAAADSSNLLPGSGNDDVDTDSDIQLSQDVDSSESSDDLQMADSDSDIRLAEEVVNESDESSELLVGMDSESDIQLVTDPGENESDESSRLLVGIDTESDLRLSNEMADNASDESAFMLMGSDADSDVRLAGEPSDPAADLLPDVDTGALAAGAGALAAGLTGSDAEEDDTSNDSSRMLSGFDSDSDVRLASASGGDESSESSKMISGLNDDQLTMPPNSEDSSALLVGLDSDSDVRLDVGDSDSNDAETQASELPLFDSDSDVRLSVDGSDLLQGLDPSGNDEFTPTSESELVLDSTTNEDSDVVLMSPEDSGELLPGLSDDGGSFDSGATMAMQLPEDSDLKLIDSSVSMSDESGISLEVDDGMLLLESDESGISLEADDSGISLEADDSGISLESLDSGALIAPSSGITLLDDESGLTLDFDDSGISLDSGDSGIALFEDDDSGISLDPDDMGQTMPMSAVGGVVPNLAASGANTMQMDMPSDGDTNDSEFELAGLDDDDDDFGTDTSVLMFDDDGADEFSVASEPGAARSEDDLVLEDLGSDDSFEDDLGDEEFEDDFDDEEMDDVWDAEDQDDEDDGFDAGESQVGGFVAPAGAAAVAGAGWAMADDRPWGMGWTTAVSIGALLSAVSAFVGAEMIRTMWMWTQPGQAESGLLSVLGGMFGS